MLLGSGGGLGMGEGYGEGVRVRGGEGENEESAVVDGVDMPCFRCRFRSIVSTYGEIRVEPLYAGKVRLI